MIHDTSHTTDDKCITTL